MSTFYIIFYVILYILMKDYIKYIISLVMMGNKLKFEALCVHLSTMRLNDKSIIDTSITYMLLFIRMHIYYIHILNKHRLKSTKPWLMMMGPVINDQIDRPFYGTLC